MNENKKLTSLILVLVLMIVAVISGTFAYWQWITATEQETLVNVSLTDNATIIVDDPTQSLVNMYPTSDCESNGTSSWTSKITVNNGTGVKLATNFKLKIKIEDKDGNIITTGTNEWNDEEFKYYVKFAVTEENESCKNALYTGRFDGTTPTNTSTLPGWYDYNSITLDGADGFPQVSSRIGSGVSFYAYPNTSTSHTYKVWVWIDKDYTSVTVGNDSSMDKMQDAKITVSWSENSGLEQIRITEPVGEAIAIYSETDNSLRFYRETNPESVTVGSTYNGRKVTEIYIGDENDNFDIEYTDDNGDINAGFPWVFRYDDIKNVIFEDYIYPTSTAYWFTESYVYGPYNIDYMDVTKLDTYNVNDMSNMFNSSEILNIIGIETWDTSNVTNMSNMFAGASGAGIANLDLRGWNVCNVTNYEDYGTITNAPYFGDEKHCNGNVKISYFTIFGLDYKELGTYVYVEGMTWAEFVDSEYNPAFEFETNGKSYDKKFVWWDENFDNYDPTNLIYLGSGGEEDYFMIIEGFWYEDSEGGYLDQEENVLPTKQINSDKYYMTAA